MTGLKQTQRLFFSSFYGPFKQLFNSISYLLMTQLLASVSSQSYVSNLYLNVTPPKGRKAVTFWLGKISIAGQAGLKPTQQRTHTKLY